ncbi:MAG: hypothetical protein R2748_06075 [Bryobacterales bacterium]
MPDGSLKTTDMLIGALLRVPAQVIHRRIIQGLNAAGLPDRVCRILRCFSIRVRTAFAQAISPSAPASASRR